MSEALTPAICGANLFASGVCVRQVNHSTRLASTKGVRSASLSGEGHLSLAAFRSTTATPGGLPPYGLCGEPLPGHNRCARMYSHVGGCAPYTEDMWAEYTYSEVFGSRPAESIVAKYRANAGAKYALPRETAVTAYTYCIGYAAPGPDNVVKIGRTTRSPLARMADLDNTSSPYELVLLWSIDRDLESALHTAFTAQRIRTGREWFVIDDAAKTVESMADQLVMSVSCKNGYANALRVARANRKIWLTAELERIESELEKLEATTIED